MLQHLRSAPLGPKATVAHTTFTGSLQTNENALASVQVKVPLEVVPQVKHTEGVLSMARSSDPNSGGSSFSVLLGTSPHLDMQYTVFGKVLHGMENMHKMESLPTQKQGIFVMPVERVTIHSTFMIFVADPQDTLGTAWSLRQVDTGAVFSLITQKVRAPWSGRL